MKIDLMSRCLLSGFLLISLTMPAGTPPSLETLKAKAQQAQDGERGKLYAEIVGQLVEVADRHYIAGNVEKAESTVDELADYAQKARESLRGRKKKVKDSEIILRKAQRRLEDVGRTLAAGDQPRVQKAVNRIVSIRRELLDQMFKH